MYDIYKNIKKSNPNKKGKILMIFDIIADILGNGKPNAIVTDLSIEVES